MDDKQRFVGSLRGAILTHTAGKELGREKQTRLFLCRLNSLIAEYEVGCVDGEFGGLVRCMAADPSVQTLIAALQDATRG